MQFNISIMQYSASRSVICVKININNMLNDLRNSVCCERSVARNENCIPGSLTRYFF